MPSLNSVQFDHLRYRPQAEPSAEHRDWLTPDGDLVSLFYFALEPDLPPSMRSIRELERFYTSALKPSGGRLVDVGIERLDGCDVVRMIFKVGQEPAGLTYVGSLILPFRKFSFVIKVQCPEVGITGMREAVLLSRRLGEMHDLSYPEERLKEATADCDSVAHDKEFPHHPVSRLRRDLDCIRGTLRLAADVKKAPPFPLPSRP